jgi:hypothetical protein
LPPDISGDYVMQIDPVDVDYDGMIITEGFEEYRIIIFKLNENEFSYKGINSFGEFTGLVTFKPETKEFTFDTFYNSFNTGFNGGYFIGTYDRKHKNIKGKLYTQCSYHPTQGKWIIKDIQPNFDLFIP